jgi:hypothetical protein
MSKRISFLQDIRVASACPAKWAEMDGDDHKRFCHQCQKHFYNFAEMPADDVDALLESGDVCGRLYRRADGTILTADCPTGFRISRKRLLGWTLRVTTFVLMVTGAGLAAMANVEPNGGNAFARTPAAIAMQRWIGRLKMPEPEYTTGSILMPIDD